MLAIIGSNAFNHHHYLREPKDMDIIGLYDEIVYFSKEMSGKDGYGKLK